MKCPQVAAWVFGLAMFLVVCPVVDATADEAGEGAETAPPAAPEKPSTMKAIASVGLSVAGFAVILALAIHTLSKNLKYDQARNALIHLLRTNPNQAELQCQTMPNTFYDAVAAAMKGAAMTGTQDPAIIATATVPSFDAIGSVVMQHWKGLIGKSKLAAVAVIGGVALGPGILTITLGVLSIAGIAWLFYFKAEVDRSIFRAKIEVLPDLERAFVDGRYYIAPK